MLVHVVLMALFLLSNVYGGKQALMGGGGGGVEYAFDRSGTLMTDRAKYWIDFSQDPGSSPITSSEGIYEWSVNGSPIRYYDGTYPAGLAGTQGYKWITSDDVDMRNYESLDIPTFSTHVLIITSLDVAASVTLFKKVQSVPTVENYLVMRTGEIIRFYTIKDGVSVFINVPSTALTGRINCIVTTLDGSGGTAGSTGNLYVDEQPKVASAVMNDAADNSGSNQYLFYKANSHHYASFYDDYWTEARARSFCRRFYGLTATDGNRVTVTSATPAATLLSTTGDPSYLVSTSPNNAIVGAHGFYAHPAVSNLIQRASFETADQWTTTLVAGDGSAVSDSDATGIAAHGLRTEAMTLTGTTSSALVGSACVTDGIAADLYTQVQAKKASGTSEAAIRIHEYSDAACSVSLGTTDIRAAGDLTTTWAEYGGLFAAASWNGSTASWRLELVETCDGGCVTHWDAVQAVSRSAPTRSYCVVCDTDATCACTAQAATIPQPLSVGDWKISAIIRSAHATAGVNKDIFYSEGTSGDNNKLHVTWDASVDRFYFTVYDKDGTPYDATKDHAFSADTDYLIEAYHYADSRTKICVDGSCGSIATGGIMDDIFSTLSIGPDADLWIRNLKVEGT